MGQYYMVVCPEKREFLYSHDLGSGLKLLEQLNTHPGTLAALGLLLAVGNGRGGGDLTAQDYQEAENTELQQQIDAYVGRWAGHPVFLAGDYAERGDLPDRFEAEKLYHKCHTLQSYTGNSSLSAHELKEAMELRDRDCANHACDGVHFTNISEEMKPLLERACYGKFDTSTGLVRFIPENDRFCDECHEAIPDAVSFITRWRRPEWNRSATPYSYTLHMVCAAKREENAS